MIQTNTLEIEDSYLLYEISQIIRKAMYDTISLEVERIYEFECSYVHELIDDSYGSIYSPNRFKSEFVYSFNTGYRFLLSDFKYIIQKNNKQLNIELSLNKNYNYDNLIMRCMIVVERNIPTLYIPDDLTVSDDEEYQEIVGKINKFLNDYFYDKFSSIFEKIQPEVYGLIINKRRG